MKYQAVQNPKPTQLWPVGEQRPGIVMTVVGSSGGEDTVGLACPYCGDTYAHLERREDCYRVKDSIHFYPIVFWGECGHRWRLVFNFHKGEMVVYTERLSDIPGDDLPNDPPIW